MDAAVVTACGQPPVVARRETPRPGDGQVRVRVAAAPITPLDVLCATGTSYFGAPATPYVPGVQGVGQLDDGRPVWFSTTAGMRPGDGSMAEHCVVPYADVVTLPDADDTLIAALGLSAVAAQMALTWRGELSPGEQVVVLGAGGVVGQAAVQLARLHGARRVVAAARSAAAQERARALGADAVVALADSDTVDDLAVRLTAACDGPADLVLDPLFGVPAAAALRTLAPRGRLVNLGGAAGEIAPFDSATLRSRSLRLLGYTNNELDATQRAGAIRSIAEHTAAGRLTVAYETVPLAEVGDAWSRQAQGRAANRIVVTMPAQ
ncbi:NADPH:quinone reductase [Micromonospora phaseoli]|uniref:NADPH:quinone reductase n=1 Tax=Micromonospora phaseoli TaxID=1144548 RepID=A0A1H6YAJ6_9ACTN|nr:zinc-binding dehydrogenase [Micromonospora phaseoli]PZW00055.1 NADPH:quinone reductase-like Zn-dependent oxidoreductase [Micromonospora phaseoli]GIJ79565.1 NADPH:quinone reductase [Micromonospora phaseoli]SEJ36894.1 NADPH:quinone reductase [Micromonospora phaseoli]